MSRQRARKSQTLFCQGRNDHDDLPVIMIKLRGPGAPIIRNGVGEPAAKKGNKNESMMPTQSSN